MTNCYCPRGVYDMYRVGADPVKLNQQFYCRKRIIRSRLFYRLFRGRMYWVSLDILHKIHEIYKTVTWKIHRMEGIVCRIAKLEAPILAALTR